MIEFQTSFEKFPQHFYSKSQPKSFPDATLLAFNSSLAKELKLDKLNKLSIEEITQYFSGQKLFDQGAYISVAYSGHQFGHFNPTLGDGRAVLIGETKSPQKFDIQLKGSGPTAYSRNGDGLSALGPVIREYLVSESMHHLKIPTTRALCACITGEKVSRQTLEPGGVLTRVASSHLRIGNFEFLAANHDSEGLESLLNYAIQRHYPEINSSLSLSDKALEFLKAVSKKQASLISKWMAIGFIHGVMNTDNMSICGETIDYGPCAFMDHFKKDRVFSFIDSHGRYAYNNQLKIGLWNIYQLANSLLLFFSSPSERERLEEVMNSCHKYYEDFYIENMSKKFGLKNISQKNKMIFDKFFFALEDSRLDFTNSFIELMDSPDNLRQNKTFKPFFDLWDKESISIELMRSSNPYLIPRNHHIEKIIQDIYSGDHSSFEEYIKRLQNPFSVENLDFLSPPSASEVVKNTFCGT